MNKPTTNPWKILGVNLQTEEPEIRAAYIALAQQHHPDKGGDPSTFAKINEAYRLLTDRKQRSLFMKDLAIWNKCCPMCKGIGVVFKQRGLVGRDQKTCSSCGGAGVIIEEDNHGRTNRKSSRVAPRT